MQIYCLRCKAKVNVPDRDLVEVKWKKNPRTGKRAVAAKGECPKCGTGVYRILRQE